MLPRVLHAYLKQVSSSLVFANSDRCIYRPAPLDFEFPSIEHKTIAILEYAFTFMPKPLNCLYSQKPLRTDRE